MATSTLQTVCCPGTRFGWTGGTISQELQDLFGHIQLYTARQGLDEPVVLSACRTPEEQLALQRRWDNGDREGIAVRPADPANSNHIADENGVCWAFDLGNSREWLARIGPWVMRNVAGATWGGVWMPSDPGHFQLKKLASWQIPTGSLLR